MEEDHQNNRPVFDHSPFHAHSKHFYTQGLKTARMKLHERVNLILLEAKKQSLLCKS
jgi:hypothetical protein